MTGVTATGRPREVVPFPVRALITGAVAIAVCEVAFRFACSGVLARELPLLARVLWPALLTYERLRAPFAARAWLAVLAGLAVVGVVVLGTRAALLLWHNQVVARVTGSFLRPEELKFPQRKVDVLAESAPRWSGRAAAGVRLAGLEPASARKPFLQYGLRAAASPEQPGRRSHRHSGPCLRRAHARAWRQPVLQHPGPHHVRQHLPAVARDGGRAGLRIALHHGGHRRLLQRHRCQRHRVAARLQLLPHQLDRSTG